MTREEAIKLIDTHTVCFYNEIDSTTLQALHLAIEALSAEAVSREFYEDVVKANHGLAKENSELKEQIESAEAVQGEWIEKYNGNGWNDFWDYTCSACGKKYERANAVLYHANYCPNCGADMRGKEE